MPFADDNAVALRAGLQVLAAIGQTDTETRRGVPSLEQARIAIAGYVVAQHRDRPPAELAHCEQLARDAARATPWEAVRDLRQRLTMAQLALAWIEDQHKAARRRR